MPLTSRVMFVNLIPMHQLYGSLPTYGVGGEGDEEGDKEMQVSPMKFSMGRVRTSCQNQGQLV